MLVIRLKRVGRRNQPSYRVIVTPKRAGGPKGKPIEYLGWYSPLLKSYSLKQERILYWLSQGAQLSETMHNLLIKAGVVKGKKIPVHKKGKKTKGSDADQLSSELSNQPQTESASVLAETVE